MSIIPENYVIQKYSVYLVDNVYISNGSLFSPTVCVSNTISNQRTTNACESFRVKFNKMFLSHSNIYEFSDVLKQF